MLFDAVGAGGPAATAGGGAAGSAAKGTGAEATVWAGSATDTAAAAGAEVARATGDAALAGRASLAVRWIVVDLLDLIVLVAGSALGAIGSLAMVAGGSLAVGTRGALSVTGIAWVTGWVAPGATWAKSWVEERARTAAIAVTAGRIFAFLWVILRATNGEPLWVRAIRRRVGRSVTHQGQRGANEANVCNGSKVDLSS